MKLLTKDKNNKYQLNPKLSVKKRKEIDVINKCDDCELRRLVINIKTQEVRSYCPTCQKDCDEELGNNAEPIKEYPDLDYDDDSELGGHYKNEPWEHVR